MNEGRKEGTSFCFVLRSTELGMLQIVLFLVSLESFPCKEVVAWAAALVPWH
jgi:hypothetical protein